MPTHWLALTALFVIVWAVVAIGVALLFGRWFRQQHRAVCARQSAIRAEIESRRWRARCRR